MPSSSNAIARSNTSATSLSANTSVSKHSSANDAPPTQSQMIAQAMISKAVTSGKLTATEIAERTFDAIRRDAFYIVSHPDALDGVRQGAEDIMALRNPTDPFVHKPELRAQLEAALRA